MSNVTPSKGDLGNQAHGVKKLNFEYGRSVSDTGPALDLSSSSNNKFQITLNGDGPHEVTLKNTQALKDGNSIAQEIEKSVRLIRSNDETLDRAFSQFVCSYNGAADRYVLISGEHGPSSSVVVTDAVVGNIATALNLGLSNSGTEDTFYPRQNRFSTYVELTNEAGNPVPVEIVGIDEISINNAQISVDLTHLDNEPESGDTHDSIRIGDGVEELGINPDGSINVKGNISVENAESPVIINQTSGLAGVEESISLPIGTKRFLIKPRTPTKLQVSYNSGQTNTNFISVNPGKIYEEKNINLTSGLMVYYELNKPNIDVEIVYWT